MKKILICLLLIGALSIGCATDREYVRAGQGAALGAGIGYLAGKGPGALAGSLIGGAAGSIIGTLEGDQGKPIGGRPIPPLSYPPPSYPVPRDRHLGWLYGSSVGIRMAGWDNSQNVVVRPIVIDGLRRLGATVTADGNGDYVAEVQTLAQGRYAFVSISISRGTSREIMAMGSGEAEFFYDWSDQYKSYQWAARRAVTNLH